MILVLNFVKIFVSFAPLETVIFFRHPVTPTYYNYFRYELRFTCCVHVISCCCVVCTLLHKVHMTKLRVKFKKNTNEHGLT